MAQIRKEFDIRNGDVLIMQTVNGEIKMISLDKAVENAQALVRKYVPEKVSLVDELIQSRREEYLSYLSLAITTPKTDLEKKINIGK